MRTGPWRRQVTGALLVATCIGGGHVARLVDTQPGTPALSTGESELRALSRGVAEGQLLRHIFEDFGFEGIRTKVKSDASAALANAAKLERGRMRHVMVSSVYAKECVRRKQLMPAKVSSELNLAD